MLDQSIIMYRQLYQNYKIRGPSNFLFYDQTGLLRNGIHYLYGEKVEVLLDAFWPITQAVTVGDFQDLLFENDIEKATGKAAGIVCKTCEGELFVIESSHVFVKEHTWEKHVWTSTNSYAKIDYGLHLINDKFKKEYAKIKPPIIKKDFWYYFNYLFAFLAFGLIPGNKSSLFFVGGLVLLFSIFNAKWIFWILILFLYFILNLSYKDDYFL